MLCLPMAAGARIVREPDGRLVGVTGSKPPSANALVVTTSSKQANVQNVALSYHGGPVLHASAPYLVFWDPTGVIPASSRALLVHYFNDVAQDSGNSNSVFSVARQYTDSTGFGDYRQSFDAAAQVIQDGDPFPVSGDCSSGAPGATGCLTDTQIESELSRLITAQHRPTGVGGAAPVYFVVLPSNFDECVYGAYCASKAYCGYHTYMPMPDGAHVLYAVVPMISLLKAEDPKACQWDGHSAFQEPNHDLTDVLLPTFSHEYSEAITDPLLNGWYTTGQYESADLCSNTGGYDPLDSYDPNAFLPVLGGSASDGDLYDQLVNGDRYYVQSEWSNGAQGCAMRPANSTLVAKFALSASSAGGLTVSFSPSASVSSSGFSSATWEFGGEARQFSAGAPVQVSHTFPAPGSYTVSLTVVDRLGNMARDTQTVIVGPEAGGGSMILTTGPRASAARANGGVHRHRHRHGRRGRRHRHHRPNRIFQALF